MNLESLRFKEGLTESYCLNKVNEALKHLVEDDISSGEIVYIATTNEAAEKLFNELFEGATYQEYRDYSGQDNTWDGDMCDISMMLSFIDAFGQDIFYSIKKKEFYKESVSSEKIMTWEEAQDVMANGGIVESQVSFTRYEMLSNGTMLAEGEPIDEKYIKDKEYDGNWKQVEYLRAETKEDLMSIPDEDIQKELSNVYKKAKFDMEYREN